MFTGAGGLVRATRRAPVVPSDGQCNGLSDEGPHVRFEGRGAGVEHVDPVHPFVDGMRHDVIQGGEVMSARSIACGIRMSRLRAKE